MYQVLGSTYKNHSDVKQDDATVITETDSGVTNSNMQDVVQVDDVQGGLGVQLHGALHEGDNVEPDKVTGIAVTSSGVTPPDVLEEGAQVQDVQDDLGGHIHEALQEGGVIENQKNREARRKKQES